MHGPLNDKLVYVLGLFTNSLLVHGHEELQATSLRKGENDIQPALSVCFFLVSFI
jgi:hypothetical protein